MTILSMKRIDSIWQHPDYQHCLGQILTQEQGRVFCGHTMQHFLDVARIGMILNLEQGLNIPRDIIYAAALLHDIGRHEQYLHGIPHEKSSAAIAAKILPDCGFDGQETQKIVQSILNHRKKSNAANNRLIALMYDADKLSRNCMCCKAYAACNWDKKNDAIVY